MTVAIPNYQGDVAPCFEVASMFLLVEVQNGQVVSSRIVESKGCEGFGRVQLLRDKHTDVLICNGIKAFYRDLLKAAGIAVCANVARSVDNALEAFLEGLILPGDTTLGARDSYGTLPLEDLVCWTKELFTSHGYAVSACTEEQPFPLDLLAEIECPVCRRKVRVAICCGAHTYRCDDELKQLYLSTRSGFDARVYVHTSAPFIEKQCQEYGIELIDPNARYAAADHPTQGRIPILQQVITGHERAWNGQQL